MFPYLSWNITTYTRFAESFGIALQNVQCKLILLLAIIDKARTGKADGYGLRMFWSPIFSSQVE